MILLTVLQQAKWELAGIIPKGHCLARFKESAVSICMHALKMSPLRKLPLPD